jgi:hypothetical protein
MLLFWDWMALRVVEKGFGMILVGPDEPRTSSASLNVWELVLGGPCEVEGPSSCSSGWIVVVQVCGRSFDGLGVQGECSEVARSVQHVSLHENHCVMSRSRDLHTFWKGVVFTVVGGNGGGTGDIGVCSGYGRVCATHWQVGSGCGGVCTTMLGVGVGAKGWERVGLVLGSS